jgi:hypothetical protein
MFGRVVENTDSSGALWLTFLLGSAGEALVLTAVTAAGGCNVTLCFRVVGSRATGGSIHQRATRGSWGSKRSAVQMTE